MAKRVCLFHFNCAGTTARGEHRFPASLGGRRKTSDLLCDSCQSRFAGTLDRVLPEQLRAPNAWLGVRPDHESRPSLVPIKHSRTGERFFFDHRLAIQGERERLVEEYQESPTTIVRTYDVRGVGGAKRLLERLQRECAEKGIKLEPRQRTERRMLTSGHLEANSQFGGDEGFRATARIALNFLALKHPEIARDPGLEEAKRWILDGAAEPSFEFAHFGAPLEPGALPPDSFDVCHRIIVGIDGATRAVAARVSFFGAYEVAIRFGTLRETIAAPSIFGWDINPRAECQAPDVDVVELNPGALKLEPKTLGAFMTAVDNEAIGDRVEQRLGALQAEWFEGLWDDHLERLVPKLNELAGRTDPRAFGALQDVMTMELQSALTLTREAADRLAKYLVAQGADENYGNWLRSVCDSEASFEAAPSGRALAELVLLDLCHELSRRLVAAPVTNDEVRELLDGEAGVLIAGRAVMRVLLELGLLHVQGQEGGGA